MNNYLNLLLFLATWNHITEWKQIIVTIIKFDAAS